MADVVLFEKRGHVGIISLNRPKAHNAVNAALSAAVQGYLDQLEADDDIWIGVVASTHPKTFCAGADLKAVNKGERIEADKGGFAGIVRSPVRKPLIAAVGGAALAGGCEIVLSCDLVVATRGARFGVPEVKRSLIPAAGGVFRLPRRLPPAVAMEMVLTGDPIPATRMHELGFVNVLADGDGPSAALDGALALAERIIVNAPIAVREAAECVRRGAQVDDEAAWSQSTSAAMRVFQTEDFKEGPLAFIEKRAPRWTGKVKAKL